MIEKDQKILTNYIKDNHKIGETSDGRGWYIVADGINGGIHYLYRDGIVRYSVQNTDVENSLAFWTTEQEASDYIAEWCKTLEPLDKQFNAFVEKFAKHSTLSKDDT